MIRGSAEGRRARFRSATLRGSAYRGAVQQAVTATGTPLSAALPDTSSSSGSVRSLIETPGTSRLRGHQDAVRAWP